MAVYDINGNEISSGGGGSEIARDYDAIVKGINHRGYNTVAPENTIPAFKLSRSTGFKYVETDVRFTSDGIAVCLHDEAINRTARNQDGTEISETVNIADITYSEALNYDFGIWKNAKYTGTKIPTFEQFLALCRNIGIFPYIELKTGTEEQVQAIVDLVKKYGLAKHATYISFVKSLLTYVVEYNEEARVGFLCTPTSSGISNTLDLVTGKNEVFVDTSLGGLTDTQVTNVRNAGLGIEIYTADNIDPIIYSNPYVTGITSNVRIAGLVLYNHFIT